MDCVVKESGQSKVKPTSTVTKEKPNRGLRGVQMEGAGNAALALCKDIDSCSSGPMWTEFSFFGKKVTPPTYVKQRSTHSS